MARNLVWLASVWIPGHKIIVWAAGSHIARDLAHLQSENARRPFEAPGLSVHMGAEAYPVLGAQMYAIGLTAAEGSGGAPAGARPPFPRPARGRWKRSSCSRP
jgi:erythromycin esterase-like protein